MSRAKAPLTGINVDQVRFCQDLLSIDRAQLAKLSGIAESKIDRLLSDDETSLSFAQLTKLAKVLGVGVLTLFEPPAAEAATGPTATLYRTVRNAARTDFDDPMLETKVKRLMIEVRRQRQRYVDLLKDEIDIPAFDPPTIDRNDIPAAAARVRKWIGWERVQSSMVSPKFEDFRFACEQRWVFVMRLGGYAGRWQLPGEADVAGFCLYEPTMPVIVVRRDDSDSRQTFTLAHELGHLVLHRDDFFDTNGNLDATRGREKEANAFAGHVLLPVDVLTEHCGHLSRKMPTEVSRWNDHFRSATRRLGVSTDVVLRRLTDERLIASDVYRRYRGFQKGLPPRRSDNGGSRQYRDREPLHLFGRRYVATVIESWNQGELSSRSASRLLDNLRMPQLKKLREHVTGA